MRDKFGIITGADGSFAPAAVRHRRAEGSPSREPGPGPHAGGRAPAQWPPPDSERIAVWSQFLEVHTLVIRALEQELVAEEDLTLAEYDVLVHLGDAPNKRRKMSELGAALLVTSGGATKLVDRMTRRGFTDRQLDPDDRRVVYAVLTTKGEQKLLSAARVHLRGVYQYFTSYMREDEIDVLRTFFARILPPEGAAGQDGA